MHTYTESYACVHAFMHSFHALLWFQTFIIPPRHFFPLYFTLMFWNRFQGCCYYTPSCFIFQHFYITIIFNMIRILVTFLLEFVPIFPFSDLRIIYVDVTQYCIVVTSYRTFFIHTLHILDPSVKSSADSLPVFTSVLVLDPSYEVFLL